MATPVKTFKCAVVDDYKIPSPDAIVAIRECSFSTQETLRSANCIDDYLEEVTIDKAAYTVSYWHTETIKAKGVRAKPLYQEVDGAITDVFTVDLTHPDSVRILSEDIPSKDKKLKLASADLARRA